MVDSEDLPLIVSREALPRILVKECLEMLAGIAEKKGDCKDSASSSASA